MCTQPEYSFSKKSSILAGALEKFLRVYLRQVNGTEDESQWNELVKTHHYLNFKQLLGKRFKNLSYIQEIPVAALSWSAPTKRINARDSFIGWSNDLRKKLLPSIVANSRFVIVPWIQIPNMGSHILGMNWFIQYDSG